MKDKRSIHGLKTVLFGVVLLFLWMPFIQKKLALAEEKPLSGYTEPAPKPQLTLSSYFSEDFQKACEKYANQHYGFRNTLVRTRNQLDYSFFNLSNTTDVVIGKNYCLYEGSYISAYYGDDYMGSEVLETHLNHLRRVKDTLDKLHVKLLFVLTPDKASFYPEYIPDAYVKGHKPPPYRTNSDEWMRGLKQRGIPAIDFNRWFVGMKKTSRYPLYAMGGIHWSKYGAYIASDSLLRYMQTFTGKPISPLQLDSIVVRSENAPEDYDIAESMNLLFRMPTRPMAYPVIDPFIFPDLPQPSVLVAGDSYYFLPHGYKLSESYFNDSPFWFYGQQVIHSGPTGGKLVADIDMTGEIRKQDVLVIFTTNRNLPGFVTAFINVLYEAYYPKNKKEK